MIKPEAHETGQEIARTDDHFESLGFAARIGLSVAGAMAVLAGGAAVFVSDNQAGTAALIVVGAALLVMGIQGTQLLRFGAGDTAVELARIRARAEVIVDTAERQDSPEVAEAVSVAVGSVIQGRTGVFVSPAGFTYEVRARAALMRVAPQLTFLHHGRERDMGVDAIGYDATGSRIGVEFRFMSRNLSLRDVDAFVGQASRHNFPNGMLVVANVPLTAGAKVVLEGYLSQERIEFVTWNDEADDHALAGAIERLLGRAS